ncbi:MAG: type II secretion system F family protein [Nanoarchaeota archaeon]
MTLDKKIEKFAILVPANLREKYKLILKLTGKKTCYKKRIGTIFLLTAAIFLFNLFLAYFLLFEHFILAAIAPVFLFPVFLVFDYLILFLEAEDRKHRVENILPDFLHLFSSSLRAGLTPYQALKSSAREEFGPLKDEIDIATTKALGSEGFEKALFEMKDTFDSRLIDKVVNLFITSLYTGSHMAELMEETARDMAETRNLKKELNTGTKTYTMFILFTVVIGSPLLFAISLQFIDMVEDMADPGSVGDDFDMGLTAGEIPVSAEFMFWLAISLLISTSIFSSILIGVIKEGNKKYGLRYAPFIGVVAIGVFFLARFIVSGMF